MKKETFNKQMIFITGSPRSGTSLVTKVIDAHPSCVILMENIFGNRRRHWERDVIWDSAESLADAAEVFYGRFEEPIIGNKVITPDVWFLEDIRFFLGLFREWKLVFVVRNPLDASMSRMAREPEDFSKVFNEEASRHIGLDFRSRFHVYVSSWCMGLKNYRVLKEEQPGRVFLLYYDDFCRDFRSQVGRLFGFLGLPVSEDVLEWHRLPHHNALGELEKDLKYRDTEVFAPVFRYDYPAELLEIAGGIGQDFIRWKERKL